MDNQNNQSISPGDLIALIRALGSNMGQGLPSPAFSGQAPAAPAMAPGELAGMAAGQAAGNASHMAGPPPGRPMPSSGLGEPAGIGQGPPPGIDLSALIRLIQQSGGGRV